MKRLIMLKYIINCEKKILETEVTPSIRIKKQYVGGTVKDYEYAQLTVQSKILNKYAKKKSKLIIEIYESKK